MKIRCILCGDLLRLNEDTDETRTAGIDPAQQIRLHLLAHVKSTDTQILTHHRKCGWLVDALAFRAESEDEKGKWRKHLHTIVDAYLDGKL